MLLIRWATWPAFQDAADSPTGDIFSKYLASYVSRSAQIYVTNPAPRLVCERSLFQISPNLASENSDLASIGTQRPIITT